MISRHHIPKWKLKKADWSAFERKCRQNIDIYLEHSDTELFNASVTEAIQMAATDSIPSTRDGKTRAKSLPYWNDDIKKSINERNRARNRMKKTKNLDDCIECRRCIASTRRTIRQVGKQHWRQYCGTLNIQTRLSTVWNMAKRMNGIHCNPATVSIVENGNMLESDKAKADAFARRFAQTSSTDNYTRVFQEHKQDIEENHRELFANNAPETEISRTMNLEFTLHELKFALGQVRKSTTTPGEDRIVYEMLTKMPEYSKEVLLRLFNRIWKTGNVPKTWKHAIVIPILKVGKDPRNAASYRPISLTSTMCKTMERI